MRAHTRYIDTCESATPPAGAGGAPARVRRRDVRCHSAVRSRRVGSTLEQATAGRVSRSGRHASHRVGRIRMSTIHGHGRHGAVSSVTCLAAGPR
jgi:hypothetical protein